MKPVSSIPPKKKATSLTATIVRNVVHSGVSRVESPIPKVAMAKRRTLFKRWYINPPMHEPDSALKTNKNNIILVASKMS